MAEWIKFKQYAGFEISADAAKIKTPVGEFELKAGKNFAFINPNTGTKNFATPETLLARAMSGGVKAVKAPKEKKEKKVKTVDAASGEKKPKVKKMKGSKLLASKKALISDHAREQLLEYMYNRIKSGSGVNGLEVLDGKNTSLRVLLMNEDGILIVHMMCQNWRDGYWFFDPKTGTYMKFVREVHQPLPGNVNIKWPKELEKV